MKDDKRNKVLKNIDKMPSLPLTVAKVLEVANDRNSTAKDLNKIISLDPVLTSKVLKLINSAYIGNSEQITSIVRAIIMLGLNTVKNLALSTAIIPIMSSYSSDKNDSLYFKEGLSFKKGFWKHSVAVGITSKLIATKMGIDGKLLEEYFIGGLIHDIGKLVMSFNYPEDYLKAIRISSENNLPLLECENEILGMNHCEVGNELAKKWVLTDELKDIVLYHHSPKEASKKYKKNVSVTYVADTFCNRNKIGFAGNTAYGPIDKEILDYLNIGEKMLYEIEKEIEKEMNKAEIFIKIS